MQTPAGLGKESRRRLAEVLRRTKGTVAVSQAADILEVSAHRAAKMLARWAKQGWLSRVRQGLYVPVPLEARTADVALEDPWVIAEHLYAPCYISGWTAAEYWGLTEQIFRTIVVMTTRKPRDRHPKFKGTDYLLKTISSTALFGTKAVWRGQVKVDVADPSRMMLDMLNDPSLGGGIRPTVDVFRAYIGSDKKDIKLLMQYADRIGNGAVLKRLGFITERIAPNDQELIAACRARLTKGNAKLDLALPADKLVSAWRLWIPSNWAKEKPSDRATRDC
ncbi:MAG: type IV toxin-antitoxin system AbiEi family antitoxin domain-containing protein [Gammaproteobacteria bacterium]|nr:type IV toxin-antitoxin system AbiEi family antitoxin domain-containing protein [Gammaproteobacteria bacterium]